MPILQDIQKLSVGTLVTFYELDLSPCQGKFGQTTTEKFRWVDGVNELGNDVVWKGITYNRFPVQTSGFDRQGDGTIPRPKLVVANIGGVIGSLAREYRDIAGAKLLRTRTFLKYLDAVNFQGGNPYADPTQFLDSETWIVDRKSSENNIYVEWELTAPFDLAGVRLPRRQCLQNACSFKYRGTECGYTGTNYFDEFDRATNQDNDRCGKRLNSCKLRFGETAILPYGGFPAVGLIGG